MNLLDRFLERSEFESYEDFKENFRLKVPDGFDYARDVVDVLAKEAPDQPALLYLGEDGAERRFDFAEIARLSKKVAAFYSSLGIGKGDRVLTLLRRRYEYWISALALHRLGAVVVPAAIQLTFKDIAYRVDAAEVKAVVALDDPFVLQQLTGIEKACPTLEKVIIAGENVPEGRIPFNDYEKYPEWEEYSGLANHDELIIYFTSGTSGYPKMAVHNRTYPLGHIVTAKYMQRVEDGGLHLTQADSGWAKFGWGNLYGQWICGSAIFAYDPLRFKGEKVLAAIGKYKPTTLCIPPTMYRLLMRSGMTREHMASIHWFATAGEPLAAEINRNFMEITGQYIHEAYGQSEGTPITCNFPWVQVQPASMGKPSPLYDVALLNAEGRRCKKGESGEVVIFAKEGQVGLLTAYCDGGEKRSAVEDGVYHTGDIAYEDEDGYYWYVSRGDDMIKSSGYRIGPFEIESVLNSHPAVKESAVIGVPDEIRGQVVCAVLALHEGFAPSEELTKELQDHVKKNTAPYKYPRVVKYVGELPKTTSGKIIRKGLKDLL